MDEWDWDTQQNETAATVHHLNTEQSVALGGAITLEIQLVATDTADRGALLKALKMFGYVAQETDDEIEVSVPDITFTFDDIWLHEERVTKIALPRGYHPDGWGFWEP